MKKLLVLALVLSMATLANAGLVISGAPASLAPDGTATISIVSDGIGTTSGDSFVLYFTPSNASMDLSGATNAVNANVDGSTVFIVGDNADGVFMDFSIVAVPVPDLPAGTLAAQIVLTRTALEDITLTLMGVDTGTTFDTKTITVPEPITMTLLGLGGLFLRRRSK